MLEALGASGIAGFLRTSFYLYPLLNAVHILAIGLLASSALLMDARILGLGRSLTVAAVVGHLRPVAIGALIAAVLTGGLLFSVQPVDYFENPAFRVKMVLLALALANAALFTLLRLHRDGAATLGKALAVLSVGLWLSVLVAGRFIGFLL